jgi:hypothetical protein
MKKADLRAFIKEPKLRKIVEAEADRDTALMQKFFVHRRA